MTASKVAPLVRTLAQTCACERVRFPPLHNAPETAGKAHVICVGTPRGVGWQSAGQLGMTQRSVWLHKAISGSARLVPDRPAFGPLAQMVERRHHTPRVTGSIPVRSTMRSSK